MEDKARDPSQKEIKGSTLIFLGPGSEDPYGQGG